MSEVSTIVSAMPDLVTTEPASGTAVAQRLTLLDAAVADYITPPPNTAAAYAGDWRAWTRFLSDLSAELDIPIPDTATNPGVLVAFVIWHERLQLAPATAERRLMGVVVSQRQRGIDIPKPSIDAARQALSNYERDLAEAGRSLGRGAAPAVTVQNLRRICDTLPDNTLAGIRDRAVLLLGFAIAARRSELAHLDVTDITAQEQGILVNVRFGKTGARKVAVGFGTHPETCPVRSVQTWTATAELIDGPLFRPIDRHGNLGRRRMSPKACGEIVTRAAAACPDLDIRLTGHSMRSGMATEARRAGHDAKSIATQGGWRPNSAELYRYMQIVDHWTDNALRGIGL